MALWQYTTWQTDVDTVLMVFFFTSHSVVQHFFFISLLLFHWFAIEEKRNKSHLVDSLQRTCKETRRRRRKKFYSHFIFIWSAKCIIQKVWRTMQFFFGTWHDDMCVFIDNDLHVYLYHDIFAIITRCQWCSPFACAVHFESFSRRFWANECDCSNQISSRDARDTESESSIDDRSEIRSAKPDTTCAFLIGASLQAQNSG